MIVTCIKFPSPKQRLAATREQVEREEEAFRAQRQAELDALVPAKEFCLAKTRKGTPCKQRAIYSNGRCKFHWIKKQVERARLVDGRDFIAITGSPEKGNGGFNPKVTARFATF
ncbi:HGGxSTG domain-containing protein [Desulfobulbus elongatus]|uniref:HGGxSTG domain-containing protein n=1 Tax=Desulfobulbus elongatus TaxID=53332 RepID=UPI000556F6E1|nr:HGGxSTG domain-containing protein [Desulfobulbus elongatus]